MNYHQCKNDMDQKVLSTCRLHMLQITVYTSGSQVIRDKNKHRTRYNNVSLTVDLPVNAKMLKEFMFKSI